MRLIMAFDCGRTAPLSGLHIQSPLHTELLLFKYFTVWSNASDVQHMLSVHLGRCASLQGGFTTVAELSWQPPPHPPPPRRETVEWAVAASQCFIRVTLVGYMLWSLNALMGNQMGDYRPECCWNEPFCTTDTDRLANLPNHTPRRHARNCCSILEPWSDVLTPAHLIKPFYLVLSIYVMQHLRNNTEVHLSYQIGKRRWLCDHPTPSIL